MELIAQARKNIHGFSHNQSISEDTSTFIFYTIGPKIHCHTRKSI
jgi:hypothetical protein